MENTTKISDLPNKAQSFSNQTNELKESNTTNYTPLNIHPNPYGISDKNPIMPNPELQPPISNKPEINEELQNMGHQPLPSRDIPNETNIYVQDPSVRPNHIPLVKNREDFLQDFSEYENELLHEEAEVKKLDNFDYIMNQIQIPILLCILFYMFNTYFIRRGLTKFIPEDLIYSDGNLNKMGIIYLSLCFGLSYFLLDYFINYVGNM